MNPLTFLHSSPGYSTSVSRLYGNIFRQMGYLPWLSNKIVTRITDGRRDPGGGADGQKFDDGKSALRANRKIYLTFDDGPGAGTLRAIEALAAVGGAASFFFLGSELDALPGAPELFERLADGGHTTGLHGYAHLNAWKHSPREIAADQERGLDALKRFDSVRWARPPYGRLTPSLLRWYKSHKLTIAFWDINPIDYDSKKSGRTRSEIIEFILESVRPGSIVLLHENSAVWCDGIQDLAHNLVSDGWELAALPVVSGTAGVSGHLAEAEVISLFR